MQNTYNCKSHCKDYCKLEIKVVFLLISLPGTQQYVEVEIICEVKLILPDRNRN